MSADEARFKIIAAVLFLVYVVVRFYFQLRQQNIKTVEVRYKGREWLLHNLVVLALTPLVLYLLTPWLQVFHITLPTWLRWLGMFIFFLGDVVFWWAHYALGRNWSPVLAIRESHELIVEGPYRYVRHPMYTAFFLIGIGLALLSANWVVGGAYLGAVLLMYEVRISTEEQMMLEQFGEAYREHCKRTGRLVPRWRGKGWG
jgi:protein-S-isoprenylcysteine O-methyltransferase Ste14